MTKAAEWAAAVEDKFIQDMQESMEKYIFGDSSEDACYAVGYKDGADFGRKWEADRLLPILEKALSAYQDHEKSKFKSDGSHFQADVKFADIFREIKAALGDDNASE